MRIIEGGCSLLKASSQLGAKKGAMEIPEERESEVVTVVDTAQEDGREALGLLLSQAFTIIQEEGTRILLRKALAASSKEDAIIHFLNNQQEEEEEEEEEGGEGRGGWAQPIDQEKIRFHSIESQILPKFGEWSPSVGEADLECFGQEPSLCYVQQSSVGAGLSRAGLSQSSVGAGRLSGGEPAHRRVIGRQFSQALDSVDVTVDIPQTSFLTLIFDIYLTKSGETQDIEVAVLLKQMRFGTTGCLNDENARGYFVYGVQVECQPCHSWAPMARCINAAPTDTPLVFTVNNTRSITTTITPMDPRTWGLALQGQRQISYNMPCHKICPAKVVEEDCTVIWSWEMLSWKAKNGFTAFEHDKPCFGLYRRVLSSTKIPSLGVESPQFVSLANVGEGMWRLEGIEMEKRGSLELAWNVKVGMNIGIVQREKMKIKGIPTPLKSLKSARRELKFESRIKFLQEKVEKRALTIAAHEGSQQSSRCWLC